MMKKLLIAVFALFAGRPAYPLSRELFAIALGVFPALAWAQTSASSPPAAPRSVGEFLVSLVPALFGLLGTIITAVALPALRNWLTEKAKTSAIANIGLKVEHFAESVVADLNATLKPKLEAALADGKLTDDEKKELRETALARMKELLGQQGLGAITGVLGIGAGAVEKYLGGILEKKVEAANVAAAAKDGSSPG